MSKLVFLTFYSILLVACASEEPAKTANTDSYFYHGDPIEIINGTMLNYNVPTTKDINRLAEPITASKTIVFTDKTFSISTNAYNNSILDKHIHKPQEINHELNSNFISVNNRKIIFTDLSQPNQTTKAFFSIRPNGRLLLSGFSLNSAKPNFKKAELLHFSIKDDNKAFSFLIYAENEEQKALISMTFSSYNEKVQTTNNHNYNEDRPIRLNNGRPSIQVCTTNKRLASQIEITASDWDAKLKNGLNYQVISKGYPPFSDLNSHCVYTIDNYKRIPHGKQLGTAYMNYSNHSNTAVDGDAFLWLSEINKFDIENEQLAKEANKTPLDISDFIIHQQQQTAAHEIGHMLGLSHQHKGKARYDLHPPTFVGPPEVKTLKAFSIMEEGSPTYKGIGDIDAKRLDAVYE